jgi:molybdopterin synthase catalytic subunit
VNLQVKLDQHPLDIDVHLSAVQDPRVGAVATFIGVVRNHDPSVTGAVTALEYSAHPDAEEVLRKLAAKAAASDGVLALAVSHRIGLVGVGEAAMIVAVATAHRALAFEVCSELVESVKADLPVWKREILADGSHVWVGLS